MIDYDHARNPHTLEGPRTAIPEIFRGETPHSLLDVGCGTGTWLHAAVGYGVNEILGIDGVDIPPEKLLFPPDHFKKYDLTRSIDLGRKFDVALCLEVAEHLDERDAPTLVETLTRHADTILFSAACPGQPGQHHVNCQWPMYWQALFNSLGFSCNDVHRWRIWNIPQIEVWYRQNIFMAQRSLDAGNEPRIKSVIHPEMYSRMTKKSISTACANEIIQIENGRMQTIWYLKAPLKALARKIKRRLG